MAGSDLIFIDYEGPADYGRVTMRVGRNFASIAFEKHPMVVSKAEPWQKRISLSEADSKILIEQAMSDTVKKHKCESLTLMPGQDVTVKSLRISAGKSPPYFQCDFVETPPALKGIVESLGRIYKKAKNEK